MAGLLTNTDDNATATLQALLKGLKARVTRATVRSELPLHPDFPSMLSLSEVLTGWKIDNMALQLNNVEQLRELPLPFIAHLRKKNGWYVLVTNVAGDTITYTDSSEGHCTEPMANFEREWSGVALLAESCEESGEPDYETNRKQERLNEWRSLFLITGIFVVILLVILSAAKELTAPDWLLLLTKTIGLGFSGLLIAKQLGSKNALTDRLCHINSKTDCDSVLNSPAAKLWGWLSWTDVGLLYFAGGLLTILLSAFQLQSGLAMVRPLLSVFALLALPYTIFSIYYQARVIRQWCPLCLGVQGVLLVEGSIAVNQLSTLPTNWQSYVALSIAFLVPTLVWLIIRPFLTGIAKSRKEHNELMKFKRDPDLFRSFLEKQPRMPLLPNDLKPIIIGSPDAENTIRVITNPYCGPCATKHKEIDQLLKRNSMVKAQIIFFACDGKNGKIFEVSRHLLALSDEYSNKSFLTTWFEDYNKNYKKWSEKNTVSKNLSLFDNQLYSHCDWCKYANIHATPAIFINGFKLPELYDIRITTTLLNYLALENNHFN